MAKSKRQTSKKAVTKTVQVVEKEEEEVNYAQVADAFAHNSDEEEEEPQQNGDENSSDEEQDQEEESDDKDDDEDSSSDEEEEEDGADVSALFKGSAAADEQDDDSSGDDEEEEPVDQDETPVALSNKNKSGPEHCNFDLRNLTAMNSHQLAKSLHLAKRKDESISIPLDAGHAPVQVNEEYLLQRASEGCAQLIAAVWQLPTETSDAGPLATLPGYDEIPLPRAMVGFDCIVQSWESPKFSADCIMYAHISLIPCCQPPPPPKQETKWEKFAKAKGIPLNKEKRSRKVWDEETGAWMYRHGYEKANSKSKEWPIMEVGANDDPYADPWEKVRDAKRARTEKNLENQLKNQERVGGLAKGTTNRVLKSREKSRTAGKVGGNADRDNVLPVGVPVDLKGESGAPKLRGKASTTAALEAVQRSTASLGKFDQMREGEPERKKILAKMKKRKYESATDKKVIMSEGQKSMKILNAVIDGGGVTKEKDIRKGKYAKGETAYDYEFNDGLGASTFKKKKGRAGAGKMRKMTKKRAK